MPERDQYSGRRIMSLDDACRESPKWAAAKIRSLSRRSRWQPDWMPIETAPSDRSVMLYNPGMPMWFGRYRYGQLGEPQQDQIGWRCDSSGRFGVPTHWAEKPEEPGDGHE